VVAAEVAAGDASPKLAGPGASQAEP